MITKDDRTDEQKITHTFLVVGTDRFMSGWGWTKGGYSYAAWACKPKDVKEVFEWVKNRSDMSRVRVVSSNNYKPSSRCKHFHIYVADES
jgi:hypothetical protein